MGTELPENQIICGRRDNMKSYKCITINGKQVRLHRYLMQQHLGRKLNSNELVHHIDGNIHNNCLENLALTTRGRHMKTHNIGEKTRFKKKHNISREKLQWLYEECGMTIQQIADYLKLDYGVVWLRMKEYQIRENMKCVECGSNIQNYVRARFCNRCYQRKYQRWYRANKRAV